MDGVLRLVGKPEAVAAARKLGMEGLQVTLGGKPGGDRLLLDDPALQARFVEESKRHSLPICATYLDILHQSCLKNDPASSQWVLRGIEATRRLGAPILMTVFFGKCSVVNRTGLDYVADAFKDLAKEAERASVIIGFENLLPAEDNARALDRVASPAFNIYYDIGNSTNAGGFDVSKEIRWLGRDRICQFHGKDKGYLGEGKIDVADAVAAMREIGFQGFANLETSAPSGDTEKDLVRNAAYLSGIVRAKHGAELSAGGGSLCVGAERKVPCFQRVEQGLMDRGIEDVIEPAVVDGGSRILGHQL